MFEYEGIKIHWLGHDAFLIIAKGKHIYLDPYKLGKSGLPKADIIISSHEHFDHCNPEAINQVSSDKTILIGPTVVQDIFEEQIDSKKGIKEVEKQVEKQEKYAERELYELKDIEKKLKAAQILLSVSMDMNTIMSICLWNGRTRSFTKVL